MRLRDWGFWGLMLLLLFIAGGLGFFVGHWRGALWANMASYQAGYHVGYGCGLTDAETAFVSGGGVVKIQHHASGATTVTEHEAERK